MTPSDGKLKGVMGAWLADCIADKSDTTKDFARFQNCEDAITVTVNAGEGGLRPVRAKFLAVPRADSEKQEDAYSDIRVELSLAPENGKTEDDYRMTLTMQGTLTTEGLDTLPAEEEYVSTYKTIITWGSPKIVKGIADKGAST